ncbi:FGGY-family carbohydrate kinase [Paracoccus albus]|uniref:FGGY-family carbohydrate kinase n=1 Tax=Paracoccus albus TaxID=3017784 RepID=UPI0022F0909F|nr:FGGY-family carbohydrate kinase [Paracoccus albus]WBU60491.1 FGGY-family carbohydrate kinase [Paracoccus albus]
MADRSRYLVGVDVGTGSARAGVFDTQGYLQGTARHDIQMYRESGNIVEQSSDDIWTAVASAVQGAVRAAGVAAEDIAGISFDATCSLVVLGASGEPMPVGDPAYPERNIMVWMDHRAREQAKRINQTGHRVLDFVGGRISPEMETPKLLWLKENRPEVFDRAWQFMDLTDFLTWKATGDLSRSVCTVTCKWTYLAHEGGWDSSYFHEIGLGELAEEGFSRIGTQIREAGSPLGSGLTDRAAEELGLLRGTPVGTGLIDAHAGGVGTVGAKGGGGARTNLGYVFGTSSCMLTSTAEPVFAPGVWGPYFSAMVPGMWLNEGGQSAAGAAIDQLLDLHPFTPEAQKLAKAAGMSLPAWLASEAEELAKDADPVDLAKGLHIVPEFMGNRSPHADPDTRAVIAGLGMSRGLNSLIALYVAGICGIGYGLRQIVAAQAKAGAPVGRVVISGGAGRSDFIRQLLADASAIEFAATEGEEPVLLGSAMLGAVAGGIYPDLATAMGNMSRLSAHYPPKGGTVAAKHDKRFRIWEDLQSIARKATQV